MLTKAIIPAAGLGTRVAELAGERSKECLKVAGLPMIAWALLELALAGVEEVGVVVAPRKLDLVELLGGLPPFPSDERIAEVHPGSVDEGLRKWPRIAISEQHDPQGVVHAIAQAADYVEGQPFLVMMPDNFFIGGRAPAAAVGDRFAREGGSVIGVIDVDRATAATLGNVGRVDADLGPDGEGLIRRLHDKGPGTFPMPDGVERVPRAVGRTIVPASFVELDSPDWPPPVPGREFDDVPRFQTLAATGRLTGVRLDARLHDIGQAAGLREVRRLLGHGS